MHNRVAVLLVPAAAALLVACGSSESGSSGGSTAPTAVVASEPSPAAGPTASPSASPASDDSAGTDEPANGDVQEIMINVDDPTQVGQTFMVKLGQTVVLRLLSDTDQVYHVHGYDLEQKVAAGVEASFEFTADKAGSFEVETHTTDKLLATLKVA